ncbi:MAG: hypothetical protein V1792_09800 [Pseudomonadota bacterium]
MGANKPRLRSCSLNRVMAPSLHFHLGLWLYTFGVLQIVPRFFLLALRFLDPWNDANRWTPSLASPESKSDLQSMLQVLVASVLQKHPSNRLLEYS